jgi:predicted NAD/FAD-binding protein
MRIAVVGTGIAGLGAAHALDRSHEVELFEREPRVGGHTNTVDVRSGDNRLAVDTGFIVHNAVNYPRLLALFAELGVATQDSEMSLAVSCAGCGLEFSSRRPHRAGRLLPEILRFQRTAESVIARDEHAGSTLARFVASERYSDRFAHHFLVPLCAAIWSTPPDAALDFPARYAVSFLSNHGVLGLRHFRWRTVKGGSREYVRALLGRFGGQLRLDGVRAIERDPDGVTLRTGDGELRRFDRVIVATHADEALALLAAPTAEERRLLGSFAFTVNETVLHTDARFLPRSPGLRAAWNYQLATCAPDGTHPTMTYSMNRLQRLTEDEEYCVTLNRGREIDEARVIARFDYTHPQYTFTSLAAQGELGTLNGPNRTAFAGAWQGFGFHEDGLVSGQRAAEAICA